MWTLLSARETRIPASLMHAKSSIFRREKVSMVRIKSRETSGVSGEWTRYIRRAPVERPRISLSPLECPESAPHSEIRAETVARQGN